MLQKLFNQGEAGSLRRRLTKNAVGSFGLKIASVSLAFITSVLLARLLGAEGYGLYAYATAWIFILRIPAELGLKDLLVREVSAYQTRSQWSLMHGLLRWANQAVVVVSIAIALLAAVIVWLLQADSNLQVLLVFWLALILSIFACPHYRKAIALATEAPRQAIGLSGISPGQSASLIRWRWDEAQSRLTWQRWFPSAN